MKYGLIIQDLTAQGVQDALAKLSGTTAAVTVTTQPAAFAPQQPQTNGDDEGGTPANTNDLDGRGFPHNEKIHSSNPTKNKDGTWKKRKGVDQATTDAVESEMRTSGFGRIAPAGTPQTFAPQPQPPVYAAQPQPQFTAQPQPAPVGGAPTYTPAPVYAPQPETPIQSTISRLENQMGIQPQAPAPVTYAPQPQPVAAAPVQHGATAAVGPADFGTVMNRIREGFAAQRIDMNYPTSLVQRINHAFNTAIGNITEIGGNSAMVDYTIQMLNADGRA
jgi:hypothetical protein